VFQDYAMLGPVLPARRLQRTGDRRALKPTALLGACGQPGTFTKAAVRAMAESMERPVIMPLSNPTRQAEATPADLMAWTDEDDILMSLCRNSSATTRAVAVQ
jgi:malic enzyme